MSTGGKIPGTRWWLPVFGASRAGSVPAAGGTPDATKSLREDGTWSSAGGGGSGDVVGPASSSASEIALFDGLTGKLLKRATGTGVAKVTSGVLGVAVAGTDYYAPGGTDVAVADGGTGASTASGARTNLGVAIGSDVLAFDAGLASLVTVDTAADLLPYTTAANIWASTSLTAFARTLLDDADAATMRTTLGLVIGTNVQTYDAGLTSLTGVDTAADIMPYTTAANTWAALTTTAYGRAFNALANVAALIALFSASAQTLLNLVAVQGGLIYASAAGAWSQLAAGTAGQYLRTGGAAANPSWADTANVYGDGSDGVLAWDGAATILGLAPAGGVYTLTRDIYMAGGSTIAANTRIATANFRGYCSGLITFTDATSIISADGNAASGVTAGAAINAAGSISGSSGAGQTGRSTTGAGTQGGTATPALGGAGGAGGAASSGGAGGGGGTATAPTAVQGGFRHLGFILGQPRFINAASLNQVAGGAGGGSGGANIGTGTASSGGSGSGGGTLIAFLRYVTGAGVLRALGGAGGNAAATGNGKAGGGGGGGGGAVYFVTSTPSPSVSLSAAGGAFGNLAGAGANNGVAGSAGLTLTITV